VNKIFLGVFGPYRGYGPLFYPAFSLPGSYGWRWIARRHAR